MQRRSIFVRIAIIGVVITVIIAFLAMVISTSVRAEEIDRDYLLSQLVDDFFSKINYPVEDPQESDTPFEPPSFDDPVPSVVYDANLVGDDVLIPSGSLLNIDVDKWPTYNAGYDMKFDFSVPCLYMAASDGDHNSWRIFVKSFSNLYISCYYKNISFTYTDGAGRLNSISVVSSGSLYEGRHDVYYSTGSFGNGYHVYETLSWDINDYHSIYIKLEQDVTDPSLFEKLSMFFDTDQYVPPDLSEGGSYDDGYSDGKLVGYDEGYKEGYSNGLNKGQSDQVTSNPLGLFLQPVSDFMHIQLFGTIALVDIFNIILYVSLALVLIKMFAG